MKFYSVMRYRKTEYFRRLTDAKKAARSEVSETNLTSDVALCNFSVTADNVLCMANGGKWATGMEVVYTAKYRV